MFFTICVLAKGLMKQKRVLFHLLHGTNKNLIKGAPGEARTLDLRISSSILTYKYDALTDCATGAVFL